MKRLRLLLLRPQGNDPAPLDQAQGSRLAALQGPAREIADLEEDSFERGNLGNLERKLRRWAGRVSGVVGATNVPEAARLGQLAEESNIICLVANNNPSVWQGRRRVFHIGLPSRQTAVALAQALRHAGYTRVFLLHDETEFQGRVAFNMLTALQEIKIEVNAQAGSRPAWLEEMRGWKPDLLYLIYSEEKRALPIAGMIRSSAPNTALLVGRSLLRSSFIASLGAGVEGVLFVDFLRRARQESTPMAEFTRALTREGVDYPTANHGFGWDAMTLCSMALAKGEGDALRASEYLESGVLLEGVTGQFRFSRENHNGREGPGPTRISRWRNGRLEKISHD
jgi:ABC-type branched-subunit amino acid transport system substrate-binding protein